MQKSENNPLQSSNRGFVSTRKRVRDAVRALNDILNKGIGNRGRILNTWRHLEASRRNLADRGTPFIQRSAPSSILASDAVRRRRRLRGFFFRSTRGKSRALRSSTIAPWFLNEPRPTIQLWQVFVHNSNNFTLRLRRDCESCWKRKKRKKGRKEGEISFARCAHFNSNFHLEFIIPHNAIVTVVLYLLV